MDKNEKSGQGSVFEDFIEMGFGDGSSSLLGFLLLRQSLDDLLLLGLEALLTALTGLLGFGAASFSLVAVGHGEIR